MQSNIKSSVANFKVSDNRQDCSVKHGMADTIMDDDDDDDTISRILEILMISKLTNQDMNQGSWDTSCLYTFCNKGLSPFYQQ